MYCELEEARARARLLRFSFRKSIRGPSLLRGEQLSYQQINCSIKPLLAAYIYII